MDEQRARCMEHTIKGKGYSTMQSPVRNEKGIALVMILILAAIALVIMAGLLFMITSSTQISGMQKRYKTALEAGKGGAEVTFQFIGARGNPSDTTALENYFSTINPAITTPGSPGVSGSCTGTDIFGTTYSGLAAKLNAPTSSWSPGCNSTLSIDPSDSTSYDFRYDLGTVGYPTYRVYAKIVDTVDGNSAADTGLGGEGVVVAGGGTAYAPKMPYLYTIEMDAQNLNNPIERSKLSILYLY